jgi:uncharacterized protein YndB with AHSA1/START domain
MMFAALMLALGLPTVATLVQPAPPTQIVTVTKIAAPEKALRLEVTVPASLDAVWTAFTTQEGLATWLWRDVRVDLRRGGDWLVLFPGGKTGGGTILSFTPTRQITIAAMAPEQFPEVREQRTTVVFEFDVVTPSTTKVTLVQTGWKQGREWDEAYEYLADGNATLLRQLHQRFLSGPLNWPKSH